MFVNIFVLTFSFLFLYFLFLLQYIFVCEAAEGLCTCLLFALCFKEAEGLCVSCYITSKKQKACILFVVIFCLIFYSVCKAAGGLCAVCYFWRRMPVYCLLFYFVCRTAGGLCACLIFLVFALCFKEGVSSSKIRCSNIL